MRTRRRNLVRDIDAVIVAIVAVAAGCVAATAGNEPTGRAGPDALLTAATVAAVVWASATAPWWMVVLVGGLGLTLTTDDPVLAVLSAGAVLAGIAIGYRRANLPWLRAGAVALAAQVFVRLDLDGFHGLSALIAGAAFTALLVIGVQRRSRRVRHRAHLVAGGVAVFGLAAGLGLAAAVTQARSALQDGDRLARQGLDLLEDGDVEGATAAFELADAQLRKAAAQIGRPWTQAARLVPVVAQHRDALAALSDRGADLASAAARAAGGLDLDTLQLTGGRVDLDAVSALQTPVADVAAAVAALDREITEVDSPWLVAPAGDRLTRLQGTLQRNDDRLARVADALALVPALLGGDGPRRYFVAFTTPAEARGLGGFMGNFAELLIDDGQVGLTRFGSTGELNGGGADPNGRIVREPAWLGDRYGRYGLGRGEAEPADFTVWSNVTMPPDLATVGTVIAQLYPQSGGVPIDGVIVVDPFGLAGVLELTGPVAVPGLDQPLDAGNVAPFLLRDQYQLADVAQRELLADVAEATTRQLLTGQLPGAREVGDTFAPLLADGHVMMWSTRPAEAATLDELGIAGAFGAPGTGHGFAVVHHNAAPNKIDAYLQRSVTYDATVGADGRLDATLTVDLANNAPASGLPDVVLANVTGEPLGTNRMIIALYTALPVDRAELDGQPVSIEVGEELGWRVALLNLSVPAGQTATVVLHLVGQVADPGLVTVLSPPLAQPDAVTVRVRGHGDELNRTGPLPRRQIWSD